MKAYLTIKEHIELIKLEIADCPDKWRDHPNELRNFMIRVISRLNWLDDATEKIQNEFTAMYPTDIQKLLEGRK